MREWTNSSVVIAAILGVLVLCGTGWAGLTDGLVGHWEFEDGGGNVALDSAGGNHGVLEGDPSWAASLIGDGALDFDGDGDYVDIPYNSSLDIDASTGISISIWIKLRSYPSTGGLDGKPIFALLREEDTDTKNFLAINRAVDGSKIMWDQYPPSGGALTSIKPDLDTWYHVVAVQNATSRAIYINGILDASDNSPESYTGDIPNVIRIGHRTVVDHYFDGLIDDVRIYDRVLSVEEVLQLYHGELVDLEIVGPDEVAEDSQTQYRVIAHYADGGTQDVTTLADWSVEPNDIAGVAAGLLTTEMIDLPTDITITADYNESGNVEAAQKQVSIFAICPSGSALEFDGVDDYVDMGDTVKNYLDTNYTVSAWIKTNTIPLGHAIVAYRHSSLVPYAPLLFQLDHYNTDVRFTVRDDSGNIAQAIYTDAVTTGVWYHVAGVRQGDRLDVYVNGMSGTSDSQPFGTISVINSLKIGPVDCCGQGLNHLFDGLIDDVRIYNRALTAEEVGVIMHTRPDDPDPNMVGYWNFDEGTEQVAGDSSLYGNDGAIAGAVWVGDIAPVGICSVEDIVEKNLLKVLGMKNDVLNILNEAIGKEDLLWEYMDTVFKDRNFGNTSKGDVVKAKQKIMGAIQHEEQAESSVDQSIGKLEDALDELDIELDDNE